MNTTVTTGNGASSGARRDISLLGIDFVDTTFSDTGLIKVAEAVNSNDSFEEIYIYSDGRKVYDLGLGDYVVEYKSESQRDSELQSRDSIDDGEIVKTGFVKPKHRGSFDFHGSYFNIYGIDKSPTNKEILPFAFKGVIIDTLNFINEIMKDKK